jgi:hypothetical protein
VFQRANRIIVTANLHRQQSDLHAVDHNAGHCSDIFLLKEESTKKMGLLTNALTTPFF